MNIRENARKAVSETEGLDGYVIHVREIFPEEKFFVMKKIINNNKNRVKVVVAVLTSGILSAGLGVLQLRYLLRYNMPDLVSNGFQEIDRVGRRADATYMSNLVDIILSSNDYRFMLRRD